MNTSPTEKNYINSSADNHDNQFYEGKVPRTTMTTPSLADRKYLFRALEREVDCRVDVLNKSFANSSKLATTLSTLTTFATASMQQMHRPPQQRKSKHSRRPLEFLVLEVMPCFSAALLLSWGKEEPEEACRTGRTKLEQPMECLTLLLSNLIILSNHHYDGNYDARIRSIVKTVAVRILEEEEELLFGIDDCNEEKTEDDEGSTKINPRSLYMIESSNASGAVAPEEAKGKLSHSIQNLELSQTQRASRCWEIIERIICQNVLEVNIEKAKQQHERKQQEEQAETNASKKYPKTTATVKDTSTSITLRRPDKATTMALSFRKTANRKKKTLTTSSKLWRGVKITSVGLVVGAAFAVSGGFAAPALVAAISALGITSAVAGSVAFANLTSVYALASMFGVIGGGLAAYKMKKRTKGLTEWKIRKETASKPSRQKSDEKDGDDEKNKPAPDDIPKSYGLHAHICVSGWLNGETEFQKPWGIQPSDPPITHAKELLQRFFAVYQPSKLLFCDKLLKNNVSNNSGLNLNLNSPSSQTCESDDIKDLFQGLSDIYDGCHPQRLLPFPATKAAQEKNTPDFNISAVIRAELGDKQEGELNNIYEENSMLIQMETMNTEMFANVQNFETLDAFHNSPKKKPFPTTPSTISSIDDLDEEEKEKQEKESVHSATTITTQEEEEEEVPQLKLQEFTSKKEAIEDEVILVNVDKKNTMNDSLKEESPASEKNAASATDITDATTTVTISTVVVDDNDDSEGGDIVREKKAYDIEKEEEKDLTLLEINVNSTAGTIETAKATTTTVTVSTVIDDDNDNDGRSGDIVQEKNTDDAEKEEKEKGEESSVSEKNANSIVDTAEAATPVVTVLTVDDEDEESENIVNTTGTKNSACTALVATNSKSVMNSKSVTNDDEDYEEMIWDWQAHYSGELYTLTWETSALLQLCQLMNVVALEATDYVAKQVIYNTLLAGTVAIPSAMSTALAVVDDPYQLIGISAEKAGIELAHCLLMSTEEHRPVSLVGFSFGASVLFACLRELARHQQLWEEVQRKKKNFYDPNTETSRNSNIWMTRLREKTALLRERFQQPDPISSSSINTPETPPPPPVPALDYQREPASIVEDVVLLGLPRSLDLREWRECRGIVAGRFINGYKSNDWVVSYMIRVRCWNNFSQKLCGTHPIPLSDVENYELDHLVPTHGKYGSRVPQILHHIEYGNPVE